MCAQDVCDPSVEMKLPDPILHDPEDDEGTEGPPHEAEEPYEIGHPKPPHHVKHPAPKPHIGHTDKNEKDREAEREIAELEKEEREKRRKDIEESSKELKDARERLKDKRADLEKARERLRDLEVGRAPRDRRTQLILSAAIGCALFFIVTIGSKVMRGAPKQPPAPALAPAPAPKANESRFNDNAAYRCTVTAARLSVPSVAPATGLLAGELSLDFRAIGDMSLGPLQAAGDSTVLWADGDETEVRRPSSVKLTTNDPQRCLEGVLVFDDVPVLGEGELWFQYGSNGYSQLPLCDVDKTYSQVPG